MIDVQGARQVRRAAPGTVGVFVLPPSFAVLEQRLRGRSKDTEEAMQRRLQTARDEVAAFAEYDYVVVNDELEACVERLRAIVDGRARAAALGARRRRADRQHVSRRVPERSPRTSIALPCRLTRRIAGPSPQRRLDSASIRQASRVAAR